jgi:hypothetical protein
LLALGRVGLHHRFVKFVILFFKFANNLCPHLLTVKNRNTLPLNAVAFRTSKCSLTTTTWFVPLERSPRVYLLFPPMGSLSIGAGHGSCG